MELDTFKQSWEQQSSKDIQFTNKSVLDIIYGKSNGPLAALKRSLIKWFYIIPSIIFIMIPDLIRKPWLRGNVIMWLYFIPLLIVLFFFIYAYRMINKMQKVEDSVKAIIEKKIELLETGYKHYQILMRSCILFIMFLIELFVYFKIGPIFGNEAWQSSSIFERIPIYLIILLVIYLFGKINYKMTLGKHISHMKKLLREIE